MRRSGFTLVELIISVSIIIIIATISVPVLRRMTANAKATHCTNNLRQIGVALNLYLNDHANRFPTLVAGRKSKDEKVDTIDNVLDEYIDNPEVFRCKGRQRQLLRGNRHQLPLEQHPQRAKRHPPEFPRHRR